ncbi:MAG TPA: hypothetical protein EYF98_15680 [Planctomycetes bacterium]|nr:hypothetical protein [Planctomycetota bacterium]
MKSKLSLIDWGGFGRADIPINSGGRRGAGNINQFRSRAEVAWSILMSLEGMREVLFASGTPAIWGAPVMLFDPNVIRMIFASPQAREPGWEPDPDALKGIIPAVMGSSLIQTLLTMYGMGIVPSAVPVPLWALGFTKAEQGRYTTGPTVGQVARINAEMWDGAPQYSGLVVYGAAPSPEGLRARLKALVKSGQIHKVPQAQPSAVPNAIAQVAPGMAPDADALRADAASMSTGAKVALSVGAGVTLLGMTALLVKVARS